MSGSRLDDDLKEPSTDQDPARKQIKYHRERRSSESVDLPWGFGCAPSSLTSKMEEMERNSSLMPCLRQRLNSHIHTESRAVFPAAAAPTLPGNPVHRSRPSVCRLCSDEQADCGPAGTDSSVGSRVSPCLRPDTLMSRSGPL